MKNNDKYDKVITDFDLDFIKKKFDDDGVTPPVNLESDNIKNAIEKSHNKRIKFTNSKVLKTAVSLVACVAIVAVSLNLAFTQSNQKPPVTNDSLQSENAVFDTFSSAKEIKEYFKSIEKNNKSYNFFKDTIKGAETAKIRIINLFKNKMCRLKMSMKPILLKMTGNIFIQQVVILKIKSVFISRTERK